MAQIARVQLPEIVDSSLHDWMTRGGDARITLDPRTGLNRYSSTPFPRDVLAFASSTANDLSPEADDWLRARYPAGAAMLGNGAAYAACLDELRVSIRAAYGLAPDIDVFFAASGTDLEYVGLLAAAGSMPDGIENHLLGADEVGSGCIYSAAGQYFAGETALGFSVAAGQHVAGLPPVEMGAMPLRTDLGDARASSAISEDLETLIEGSLQRGRFPLAHVVHSSKTGLVVPRLGHVDALRERFGEKVCFVVDACQARITSEAVAQYLERGMIVFLTGSKFMGGPPFSGFALLPPGFAARAAPLAEGMARIFRRAEIPEAWQGREICEDTGNPGLALRLNAALFELSRFQALGLDRIARVVDVFAEATDAMANRLDVRTVPNVPASRPDEPLERPIELRTLITLDLCRGCDGSLRRSLTFDDATRIHAALIAEGIRLGQPVRCVRTADGGWGATLRIGLSMPQITRLSCLDDPDLCDWFGQAMNRISTQLARLLPA
jgi:hypothetical protein